MLDILAAWCGRYTPWAAVDVADPPGSGGLFLDISGCAHLFGGEAALMNDLLARLGRSGFAAHAAIADTPGAAWAVARHGARAAAIVAPAEHRAVLAPLPVAGLRLPEAAVRDLERLGLRHIGDLYRMPRAGLAAFASGAAMRRLDQALGVAAEPITPRQPVPAHTARLAFAEPIVAADTIARAMRCLLDQLCSALERGHCGARQLKLAIHRADEAAAGKGTGPTITVGTSRPARNPEHLMRLFADRLGGLDPGFGIEVMVLAAESVEPLSPAQIALNRPDDWTSSRWNGDAAGAEEEIAELIDRLGNRFGFAEIMRLLPRESHWPERAVAIRAALDPVPAVTSWPPDRTRPVRLFAPPEPIEATAPVPDDPPVLFRWRQVVHRVRCADGPERIAPEWWRTAGEDPDDPRDYYQVEDVAGRRFWLYRQGLYRAARAPRWFLHGLFG
jgi:protein ImuB